jgi:hypothetical protein
MGVMERKCSENKESTKTMTTQSTYQAPTPSDVRAVIEQAQALRSAYISQALKNGTLRITSLFQRQPRAKHASA